MLINMVIPVFFLALAMSTILEVDSFVGWSSTTSFTTPPSSNDQRRRTCLYHAVLDEEFGKLTKKQPWCAERIHRPGQERREVLALMGLTLGWTSNFGMQPEGTSWTKASAADDPDTAATSTSTPASSQFPLMDSSDNTFKSKTIEISWDTNAPGRFNVDSINTQGTSSGSQVRLSYQLPEKWRTNPNDQVQNYFDVEKQAKACNRITVYQASAPVGEYTSMAALQKVSGKSGVAKALHMPEWLSKSISSADMLSARKETKVTKDGDEQTYLELEMASAPSTCTTAAENENDKLNLGLFCPYDTIYLVSATILDGQLYVLVADASSDEWKRSNSDLKFVRSSFSVESI